MTPTNGLREAFMSNLIKLISSMPFGIFIIAVCCSCFVVVGCLPEANRIIITAPLLFLLCLNLLLCTLNRIKSIIIGKLGYLLLHLGVAVIIIAGFLGGLGHSAFIQVRVNQAVDLTPMGFPIKFRAESIRAEYYPSGEVKQYLTTISFLEEEQLVVTKDISVNNPAKYKGIKIYQSRFETTSDGSISGLTVKTEPALPLVWTGFTLLSCGVVVMWFGRK